ncbi:MAG: hypothetical protein Q8M09_11190 [Pseudomonadota bacterium]|nr:hypothetical protein [Pseudomonadota bacterium]MDP2352661.1 hypothetical protein [Pseudomonadota bacterium]
MSGFETKLNGTLYGLMRWADWDVLRERLLAEVENRWFAYAVGTDIPAVPLPPAAMHPFLGEIDSLLRRDHDEDYLGIVYVDDLDAPSLIKIYDPNNLGSACGSIGYKVPPGWVLSLDPPSAIAAITPLPGNRRRWWAGLRERLMAA